MKFFIKIMVMQALFLASLVVEAACETSTTESLAPSTRYIAQENGDEIWDKKTGLVWQHCSSGLSGANCVVGPVDNVNWQAALALATHDWRLPNVKELTSLLELQCNNPAVNETSFPATQAAAYWSSSPDRLNVDNAWQVDFGTGSVGSVSKNQLANVRLVKDK